jgi:hypothetical protein
MTHDNRSYRMLRKYTRLQVGAATVPLFATNPQAKSMTKQVALVTKQINAVVNVRS